MKPDTINMIRAEKAILCPIYGNYHPVSKCAECSRLLNRIEQILFDSQTVEYVFCQYEKAEDTL